MDFSKAFLTANNGCVSKISPNGKYMAYVSSVFIRVHSIKDASLVHEFQCSEIVEEIKWSPDSEFLLCCIFSCAVLHVFSLEHPEWRCKINQGSDGLKSVCWSPESRHVLTTVKLHLFITVWSLSSRKVKIIENVKSAFPSIDFSPDDKYLAVVERLKASESILLLDTSSWVLLKRLSVRLPDIAGFAWSCDSWQICAWENPSGKCFTVTNLDGQQVANYKLDSTINSAVWGNDFLYISCANNSIHVVNCATWNIISKFKLVSHLPEMHHLKVYQEIENLKELSQISCFSVQPKSKVLSAALLQSHRHHTKPILKYRLIAARPVEIEGFMQNEMANRFRGCGISHMFLSSDKHLLACRSFNFPAIVWIWDLKKLLLLSVLIHRSPVTCIQWEPETYRLLICTTSQPTPHLFVWTPKEAIAILIDHLGSEPLIHAQWHPYPSSQTLLISSSKK